MTCAYCGNSGCDCIERMECAKAGEFGHRMCGVMGCGCPRFGPCIGHAETPKFVLNWVWVTESEGGRSYSYGETPFGPQSIRVITKWVKDDWGWLPLDPYGDWNYD